MKRFFRRREEEEGGRWRVWAGKEEMGRREVPNASLDLYGD
jgi:hypothetical protein